MDRAIRVNAGNVYDDGEEIRESDDISVNLKGESVNGPFTKDFVHGMSTTPDSNVVLQQLDSTPSSSTNKSRKRKSKDKTFDQVCSNIGAMVEWQ
ncbi:hypothetical protein WN944_004299 [Citrus x changshan-huyou]|uniref:Uncharacterized protein n=1 Tax=Citrus x changshan-huyou TaxID=2935761 RepID=A0AAP0QG81_9ROSI